MRPIKYKAYILGKMWEVRAIDWDEDGVFIHTDGGFMHLCEEDDVHLLEYTGLKDRKRTEEYPEGQEIYEGDKFIGYTSYEKDNDALEWTLDNPGVVQWDKRASGFYPFILNFRWRCDVEGIEVIGNIYSDKELLGEQL